MLPIGNISLNYIETTEDAAEFLRWLSLSREVLCMDTETTGLRWWLPNFKIRLAQFGDYDTAWTFRVDRFGSLLEHVLASYTGRITGHNLIGFDFLALKACGFALPDKRLVDDSLAMSKLVNADSYGHGLEANIARYVGAEAMTAKHVMEQAFEAHGLDGYSRNPEVSERGWTEIPYCKAYTLYSGMDTISGARIWHAMNPIIQRDFKQAYDAEVASWFVTIEHQSKGIRVDLDYAEQYQQELQVAIDQTREQLGQLGLPYPSQRQKLADLLLEEGWQPEDFSRKTGAPSTKKTILENLDFDVVKPLMEWNRLTKWKTAYVDNVLKNAHNGRIYPQINHSGAKTGRQSASNPPIHQFPSRDADAWKVRRMVLPEEGESCVSIDYQAEENVLLAHFSQDKLLTKIIVDGLDIHKYNAAAIFDVPIGKVTAEQRSIAKTYSYAAGYGAQDLKLSTVLGVSADEMPAIRQRVNSAFTGVAEYSDRLIKSVREQDSIKGKAYVETWLGRHLYVEKRKVGSRWKLKETQVVNMPNQGTGAEILKMAFNKIAAAGLSHHIMFGLHDEGLFSVPEGAEGKEIAHELSRIMEFRTEFRLPLLTSIGEQTPYWSGH